MYLAQYPAALHYATLGRKRKVIHNMLQHTPCFLWYLCKVIDPHSGI